MVTVAFSRLLVIAPVCVILLYNKILQLSHKNEENPHHDRPPKKNRRLSELTNLHFVFNVYERDGWLLVNQAK